MTPELAEQDDNGVWRGLRVAPTSHTPVARRTASVAIQRCGRRHGMIVRCLLAFLLVACSKKTSVLVPAPQHGAPLLGQCQTNMSDAFFFPPGSLAPTNARFDEDEFMRRWYSKHLRAMAEPSLSCATSEGEGDSFRFLWLRTFHEPIAVRVDIRSKKATITTVTLSGAGG